MPQRLDHAAFGACSYTVASTPTPFEPSDCAGRSFRVRPFPLTSVGLASEHSDRMVGGKALRGLGWRKRRCLQLINPCLHQALNETNLSRKSLRSHFLRALFSFVNSLLPPLEHRRGVGVEDGAPTKWALQVGAVSRLSQVRTALSDMPIRLAISTWVSPCARRALI